MSARYEYEVEMLATVRGYIMVEAESETEALVLANEQGLELDELQEIEDWSAKKATIFQEAVS